MVFLNFPIVSFMERFLGKAELTLIKTAIKWMILGRLNYALIND